MIVPTEHFGTTGGVAGQPIERTHCPNLAQPGNLAKISRDGVVARSIGHFRDDDTEYGARLEAAAKAARR